MKSLDSRSLLRIPTMNLLPAAHFLCTEIEQTFSITGTA
jgi:hypothetical protein